ncbi:ATP-grasp domain-containing protein [Hirsutella rhossiliensis]|uniref:ATP-grasp domain-containing protein n=1 Tax=Hirsutella rhossiliensis TaxID=111463 RepID=A0A9P8MQ88_9HYPO|nr:ATP-grasp domain-containing protein [Hirsutella rhossiliensis]KAH0960283.1 ATP-grasp domain-containing protein [Hirsutella rhossiliensis]
MPVVIFGLDPASGGDTSPADHANLYRTLSQLRHDQQPVLSLVADPARLRLASDSRIVVTRPDDCLTHLPHVVDPETHYVMLSKRGLARSSLRTTPSTVIDVLLPPEHMDDPVKLEGEVARMTKPLDMRRVPFMVKLNQSLAGKGTLPVRSEAERARAKALVGAQLRDALPQINAANHHLHPCSLVLQDFVTGGAVGLSLFVTPKGRAVFVVCSEQHFDEKGHWAGGSVSYPDQEALRRKYAQPMEETARFLHQNGYHGPAGIDIMTDGSGTQYIIDLNARITGSYHLGPLAGHFMQRGLAKARAIKAHFLCPRAVFEETFARDIKDGRLIITGWARDEPLSLSQGGVTVGGRDELETKGLIAKVQALAVSLNAFSKKVRDSSAVTCSSSRQANVGAHASACNALINSIGVAPPGTLPASPRGGCKWSLIELQLDIKQKCIDRLP